MENLAVLQMEKFMQCNRRSLRDYPPMPLPTSAMTTFWINILIYKEQDHNKEQLKDEFQSLFGSLTGNLITHTHTRTHTHTYTHICLCACVCI